MDFVLLWDVFSKENKERNQKLTNELVGKVL